MGRRRRVHQVGDRRQVVGRRGHVVQVPAEDLAAGGQHQLAAQNLADRRQAEHVNSVTMPTLPPPPRIAQKRSGCSSALAVTMSPAAVTTCAERRLSMARPYLRTMKPMPPPVVSPPMPTEWVSPVESARPKRVRRAGQVAGGGAGLDAGDPRLGSMLMRFMSDRSTTMASSITLRCAEAVAAAAHRQREGVVAGKVDGYGDISRVCARTIASGRRSTVK